jgi:transposase
MRAYSIDLRQWVLKACDEGKWTMGQVAERFKVGEWWVYKLKRQRKQSGGIAPRKGKVGQPRRFGPEQINRLEQYVEKHPDATLERIQEKLGVNCTTVTIHHTLRRLGYRYKKNAAGQQTRSR